jgi:hypothetical protein
MGKNGNSHPLHQRCWLTLLFSQPNFVGRIGPIDFSFFTQVLAPYRDDAPRLPG